MSLALANLISEDYDTEAQLPVKPNLNHVPGAFELQQ
jgi:hypothetical protein